MQRVATGSQVAALPTANADVGTPGFFNNQAPGLGVTPTVPGPDWFNRVQEEEVQLILGAGIALSDSAVDQMLLAVKRLGAGNVTSISTAGTTTLTADNAGVVLVNASAGAVTINLPAVAGANGVPMRFRLIRTDSSGNAVSLAANGTDTFASAAWQAESAPSLALGSPLDLTGDGASHWLTNIFASPAGSAAQAFNVADGTTPTEAVALGQVANAVPIGVGTNTTGTSLSATTATFTAPSNGYAFVFGKLSGMALATFALSASLAGLVTIALNTPGSTDEAYAYLPMTAGQTSTFTVSGTQPASGSMIATVTLFFVPQP